MFFDCRRKVETPGEHAVQARNQSPNLLSVVHQQKKTKKVTPKYAPLTFRRCFPHLISGDGS